MAAGRADQHRRANQRAGLVDVHELELGQRQLLAGRAEIDALAAGHAARAGGEGEQPHHLELLARLVGEAMLRHQLERERLQRIACQQRRRLVVLDGRQIVVHQRVRMDQLDRARRSVQRAHRHAKHFACGINHQGAHALAAVAGVAHRFVQARGRDVRRRHDAREHRFHAGLHPAHPGVEARVSHESVLPRSVSGFSTSPSRTFTCSRAASSCCWQKRASSRPRLCVASACSSESSPLSMRLTIFSSSASALSKVSSGGGWLIAER